MDNLLAGNREYERFKDMRQRVHAVSEAENMASSDGVFFVTRTQSRGSRIQVDGRELLNFSSYDYLGLSQHPEVILASKEALDTYGTAGGASRIVSGQLAIHQELDRRIAGFLGVEAALTFNGGYLTNATTIGHLFGPRDLILHDTFMHRSALEGMQTSGATRRSFAHNDVVALREQLERSRGQYRKTLVCVEGAYSMDGDVCPLADVLALKQEFGFHILVDEAHSLGVLGHSGRGIGEYSGIDRSQVDIWMGTLSKSLSSCGGYVAGSAEFIEFMRYTCPGFVYSAAMSPSNTAAANEALKILEERLAVLHRLHERIRLAHHTAHALHLDIGTAHDSAVLPVMVGQDEFAVHLACEMFRHGCCVHPLAYPAVSKGKARLRFFITAAHTPEDIVGALQTLADLINAG